MKNKNTTLSEKFQNQI